MALRSHLLRSALPLVKIHGFTREALAHSVLSSSSSSNDPILSHKDPLSDHAISSLFGSGDDARRTLIRAWLDEGLQCIRDMGRQQPPLTLAQVLHARLTYNEPVIPHIPEAFALLIAPSLLDPLPAIQHVAQIANEACHAVHDQSLYYSWYANRASIAAVYAAAELHQLASPNTAHAFLDSLLESSDKVKASLGEVGTYGDFVLRSWAGIIKSSGVI